MSKKILSQKGQILRELKEVGNSMLELKIRLEQLPVEDKEWVEERAEKFFNTLKTQLDDE